MSNPGDSSDQPQAGPSVEIQETEEADEEVSIGNISDDDDEIIGSITSAALAALSVQEGDQPRPHSAMAGTISSGGTFY